MHAGAESVQITLHLDIEYAVHQRFIACVRDIQGKNLLLHFQNQRNMESHQRYILNYVGIFLKDNDNRWKTK